jgi:methyl-accepting chemotaxis protein
MIMRLNIKPKIIGGFLIVLALMITSFGFSYMGLNSILDSSNQIANYTQENYYWQDWELNIARGNTYYLTLATKNDPTASQAGLDDKISKAKIDQEKLAEIVEAGRRPLFEQCVKDVAALQKIANERLGYYRSGDETKYLATDPDQRTISVAIFTNMGAAIKQSRDQADLAIASQAKTKANTILIMLLISGAALIFGIGLSLIISNSISKGINKVKQALQKMSKGDLTEKVVIKSRDELGEMATSYNDTQAYLNTLVSQLKESANQLTAASDQLSVASKQSSESTQQVATSAQQMAKGAQEQSNNAQDTSKSINQLSEAINQMAKGSLQQSSGVQQAISSISEVAKTMNEVASNAGQAARGAKQAADSANAGAQQSILTLAGMNKIKVSTAEVSRKIEELGSRSAEIGKIVAVIDDIAAQTNLLALNAAIEAARAGEQGRGFAVVSDEVRKLAERSATATKEIADLIGSIQKGVKEATAVMNQGNDAVTEGYDLAVKAGQSLEQILKAASEVNNQVSQISSKTQQVNDSTNALVKVIDSVGSITEENTASTKQMTVSASQVSKSVETVAGIAEENSAATEEVSAAAEEMSAQVQEIVASAQTLKDMAAALEQSVAMFKVKVEVVPEKLTASQVK